MVPCPALPGVHLVSALNVNVYIALYAFVRLLSLEQNTYSST